MRVIVAAHFASDELIEQWHRECCVTVRWTEDHAFRDERIPYRRHTVDCSTVFASDVA